MFPLFRGVPYHSPMQVVRGLEHLSNYTHPRWQSNTYQRHPIESCYQEYPKQGALWLKTFEEDGSREPVAAGILLSASGR